MQVGGGPHGHANPDGHANSHAPADRDAYSHAHGDPDPYGHADDNSDADAHADTRSIAVIRAWPSGERGSRRLHWACGGGAAKPNALVGTEFPVSN